MTENELLKLFLKYSVNLEEWNQFMIGQTFSMTGSQPFYYLHDIKRFFGRFDFEVPELNKSQDD